ncbi:MAG: S8 family serine peptidase [Deltaproteobacteria bacterium]
MKHLAIGLLVTSLNLFAANIAIIDSGVDYKHKELKNNMWQNPDSKTVDSDGTTYDNDTHGWNFAENNNQIIDYKYLGTFSGDCTKIFQVQAKILQGTATQEEKDWYKAKKNDAEFLKELQKFGNFVHGTHVSGISSAQAEKAQLVGLKLIPTETPGSAEIRQFLEENKTLANETQGDNPMVKMFLTMLAQRQSQMLTTVGKYTGAVKSEVANGSFGVSMTAVKPIVKQLVKQLTGAEPTDAETDEYAKFFVNEIAKGSKDFVGASPNTLFVFAAGNDGTDNDTIPASPANVKTDNAIAVAATNGVSSLAVFSNYGQKMVEVAAPGVAIDSTVPGDERLRMSGTSMAAPYVTNVAGLVKDANPGLNPAGIKKILMGTVDVKDFLKGKVTSSGIVNRDRAVKAAQLSKQMTVEAAIKQSRRLVADESAAVWGSRRVSEKDLLVLPLPSTF